MSEFVFPIFSCTDREILETLKKIWCDLKAENGPSFHLTLANRLSLPALRIEELESSAPLSEILDANARILTSVVGKTGNTTIQFNRDREKRNDTIGVSFPDNSDLKSVAPVLAVVGRHARTRETVVDVQEALGAGLNEYYKRREEGLARLESLMERIIRKSAEHHEEMDRQFESRKKTADEEIAALKARLEAEYRAKDEALSAQRNELDEKKKVLDDRDSTHSRRQIRQDFKKILQDRNKDFALTKSTSRKRLSIHLIFLGFICATGTLASYLFFHEFSPSTSSVPWYVEAHGILAMLSFVAAVVFYIRWSDRWFQQHADEEFRLKRLDLDIDRASWVAEMAFEWKENVEAPIAQTLIDRLSRNLFTDSGKSDLARHPTEELLARILGSCANVRLGFPGLFEASLDRKGIRSLRKTAYEESEPE